MHKGGWACSHQLTYQVRELLAIISTQRGGNVCSTGGWGLTLDAGNWGDDPSISLPLVSARPNICVHFCCGVLCRAVPYTCI